VAYLYHDIGISFGITRAHGVFALLRAKRKASARHLQAKSSSRGLHRALNASCARIIGIAASYQHTNRSLKHIIVKASIKHS